MVDADQVTLGGYAVPVIMSIVLGGIYKFTFNIEKRWKTPISFGVGVILSILAMFYNKDPEVALTVKVWIDYMLYGIMLGASATGLYELQKSAREPRSK
jgi:hypothetical protein